MLTNVNPANGQEFFIHVVLSLRKYFAELDVLQNPSPRLQQSRLIGDAMDRPSNDQYVNELLRKYILIQVVYYPNSFRKIDGFVVQARRFFEDIIFSNEFPMYGISFLIADLEMSTERKHIEFQKI